MSTVPAESYWRRMNMHRAVNVAATMILITSCERGRDTPCTIPTQTSSPHKIHQKHFTTSPTRTSKTMSTNLVLWKDEAADSRSYKMWEIRKERNKKIPPARLHVRPPRRVGVGVPAVRLRTRGDPGIMGTQFFWPAPDYFSSCCCCSSSSSSPHKNNSHPQRPPVPHISCVGVP